MATLLMMIFIIPQSFFWIKLPFLGAVLVSVLILGLRDHWKIRSKVVILYYLIFCLLSTVWGVIGLIKGSPEIAVLESLRVYVAYMVIYFALTVYVSNTDYQSHVDGIVIAGALGIGLVTALTLVDYVFQLDWLPHFIKDEMFLEVGLHDGYVQMNNVNIGMLTFIVPYLLGRLLLGGRKKRNANLILGFVVAVAAVLIASRRIVMVLLFVVPLLVYTINFLTGNPAVRQSRLWSRFYFLLLFLGLVVIFGGTYLGLDSLDGFVSRFMSAFETDPNAPRPLQHTALMSAFYGNFFWGSGFGGITDVVRSDERPWTFELTYSRLLFNGGVIGFGLVILFFSMYLFLVLRKIRKSSHATVYISLLTGFLSVSIASASNPYLSSFDFLFVLSIIPLIMNSRDHLSQMPTN